jgi:hypothetical protein
MGKFWAKVWKAQLKKLMAISVKDPQNKGSEGNFIIKKNAPINE